MRAIFTRFCPNCGGEIDDERLMLHLPCAKCLPEFGEFSAADKPFYQFQIEIGEYLKKHGRLKNYQSILEFARQFSEFTSFFTKVLGAPPSSAQRQWMRRVLKRRNFSIVAPTGLGKTTFGLICSLFLAKQGQEVYLIFPTISLLMQAAKRLMELADQSGEPPEILIFHSGLKKAEQEQILLKLQGEPANFILLTTSRFLTSHWVDIQHLRFDFIFVDDVDAVLKSSKNVDKILLLLGFSNIDIERAFQLIHLKRKLVYSSEQQENIQQEIDRLQKELSGSVRGNLIVSSATITPRGQRVKLFRELLNFEIGSFSFKVRNVTDVTVNRQTDVIEQIYRLVKQLGGGGILYVDPRDGENIAHQIEQYLNEKNIPAVDISRIKNINPIISRFKDGEIKLLIGMISYYGKLVRGLDLPETIRYVLHTRVPAFTFRWSDQETSASSTVGVLNFLRYYLPRKYQQEVRQFIRKLRPIVKSERNKSFPEEPPPEVKEAQNFLNRLFSTAEILEALRTHPLLSLQKIDDRWEFVLPDVKTYIQTSGRTSRLFPGGISRGLSVILVDQEKVLQAMEKKLRWYFENVNFVSFEEAPLPEILRGIDADRALIKEFQEQKALPTTELVKSALLVVESPHKAQTIANFFGQPARRLLGEVIIYEIATENLILNVVASKGHIIDLVENQGFHGVSIQDSQFYPIYDSIKKCEDCGHQFIAGSQCPLCGSPRIADKWSLIQKLQEVAQEVEWVLLGSDPDREGEKIAWDVALSLSPQVASLQRIEFNEVTRTAITRALKQFREIDMKRVDAQIVRRIEDRWLGFVLSQHLWKAFRKTFLSAGRVQTPVLGWIIQRFDAHQKSRIPILFLTLENGYIARINNIPRDFKLDADHAQLLTTREESRELLPPPPFSTDDLLTEASRILRFPASRTMQLAQNLFEAGFITYHRTDSKRLSEEGLRLASQIIGQQFGREFFQFRSWGKEGGAHECIRPTRLITPQEFPQYLKEFGIRGIQWDHIRLYELIFKRFVASQMAPAKIIYQSVTLRIRDVSFTLEFPIEKEFEGFTLVLPVKLYPPLKKEKIKILNHEISIKSTIPLFTQGSLIAEMKEQGIGRPSTYAIILQKLFDRHYIIERKNVLIPTRLGREVYTYLNTHFQDIVSEETTRNLEDKLDQVEKGLPYQAILKELHESIKKISLEL